MIVSFAEEVFAELIIMHTIIKALYPNKKKEAICIQGNAYVCNALIRAKRVHKLIFYVRLIQNFTYTLFDIISYIISESDGLNGGNVQFRYCGEFSFAFLLRGSKKMYLNYSTRWQTNWRSEVNYSIHVNIRGKKNRTVFFRLSLYTLLA